jgi:capsular exopolysaccharide synthesis family protein
MEKLRKNTEEADKNMLGLFIHRYIPYWPLFAIVLIIFCALAWTYLYFTPPVYEVTANILIKDEKKGADEAKILDALNIYSANKIVENEIEVLRSKELLKDVVTQLHLNTPVFEETAFGSKPAYTTSPIIAELKNSDVPTREKIPFTYDKKRNTVLIANSSIPLNTWVNTTFGTVRFLKNTKFKVDAVNPLYFSIITNQTAVNNIEQDLRISAASKLSTVINLKYKDQVPARGEDILNTLILSYNRAALIDKNTLAANTLAFVNNRIKYVVKELDSIENKIEKYRTKKGVINLGEQGKIVMENVGDNDRKMSTINTQLAMLEKAERYVRIKDDQIGVVPSMSGFEDPMLTRMLQKLMEAQIQYESLKKTVPEGHPMVVTLRNEIENIRPTILENIQNQRMSLMASKNNISATNGMYSSILQTIPQKERELLEISRQQSIKNDAYSFLLHKREETALSYAASVADSRTIDHAVASIEPVSPKKWLVYLGAFAAAFIFSLAIVHGRESLTDRILFRSDIEALTDLPVVAEIIKVKSKQPIVVNSNKINQLCCVEQFRQLRAAFGLNSRQIINKKILVTSSVSSEGKSFISNNLALSIAMSGRKVVLMDLDLRNPKTSALHHLSAKAGVAEFLENNEKPIAEIIYPTENKNLYVVPSGSSAINPTELLLSGDLGKLFNHLESLYDLIIIDTCPIDPFTDAYILAEHSDATLFVIRHGFSTKPMVDVLVESSKLNALKNISIVFNAIKSRGFIKNGYGSGYGYGRKNVYDEHAYQIGSIVNKA